MNQSSDAYEEEGAQAAMNQGMIVTLFQKAAATHLPELAFLG